jgi:hypothetical protein
MDKLKETEENIYGNSNEEALTLWRNHFGTDYEPFERQTALRIHNLHRLLLAA